MNSLYYVNESLKNIRYLVLSHLGLSYEMNCVPQNSHIKEMSSNVTRFRDRGFGKALSPSNVIRVPLFGMGSLLEEEESLCFCAYRQKTM
jgi:hypothetical protein